MYITKYYQLAQQIQEHGGPGKVPVLFAQAVDMERDVLAQYGLPPSTRFIRILQSIHKHKNLNEQLLEKTIQRLETAAAEYLLSSPLPDEQLLSEAKVRHLSALDVLPEMGIPTHEYVVFVYNHFCTHRKINARQVIKEYTILKEHQCLQGINQLKNIPGYRNDPTFIRLKSYGLQFLDLYIRSLREHEKDHMTHREMERQLRELMDVAAASYLQYLQLRSSGMKDALARKRVGLEDEVFYRIALYTFMLREVTP